jgi:hypothetical protein
MSHLILPILALTLTTFSFLVGDTDAAKVNCPDGRYVLLTGGDLIASTSGVPPTIEIVGGVVTVIDGCPITKGRAKPTKKGVRVTGKFKNCNDAKKLKLKATIDAACSGVSGTISGRGVTPVPVTGAPSLCGNGVVDTSLGEECDGNVACPTGGATCDQSCHCVVGTGGTTTTTLVIGGGGGSTTTTTLGGNPVTVEVVTAFCTADVCGCGMLVGKDYHLQATGTASGPVGTELRVNVGALQGGVLDCGGWTPIGTSVNPACDAIKCCKRESGQPETANWAATEAIDLPCMCPSAPGPLSHNYLGQAQLAPSAAVESEKTTTACP